MSPPRNLMLQVFERDHYTCRNCKAANLRPSWETPGAGKSPEHVNYLMADHVNGKGDTLSNLQTLCIQCNRAKGGRSPFLFSVSEAIKHLGQPITFYAPLAKVVGIPEALILSQLLYWTPRGRHGKGEGWVHKSTEEIEEETSLSYKAQRRCRKHLQDLGLIQTRYDRAEHRLYFRVVPDKLDEIMGVNSTTPRPVNGEHLPNGHLPNGHLPVENSEEHLPKGHQAPAQRAPGTCPKGSSYKEQRLHRDYTEELSSSGPVLNSGGSKSFVAAKAGKTIHKPENRGTSQEVAKLAEDLAEVRLVTLAEQPARTVAKALLEAARSQYPDASIAAVYAAVLEVSRLPEGYQVASPMKFLLVAIRDRFHALALYPGDG